MANLQTYSDPNGTVFIDPFADEHEEREWDANALQISNAHEGLGG
jgi:hypothetical protein